MVLFLDVFNLLKNVFFFAKFSKLSNLFFIERTFYDSNGSAFGVINIEKMILGLELI